jgi:hypothetical protein
MALALRNDHGPRIVDGLRNTPRKRAFFDLVREIVGR